MNSSALVLAIVVFGLFAADPVATTPSASPVINPAPQSTQQPAPSQPQRKIRAAEAEPAPGAVSDQAPSSSLLGSARPGPLRDSAGRTRPDHALQQTSLFAVQPPEPRIFRVHDLVQIVVRETSKASSSQETETKKDYKLDIKIPDWPDLRLEDLLNLQIAAGSTTVDPKLKVESKKDFKGEGDYEREDDFTARVTAEVIEVLPNGNLILEARTFIKTDREEATMKVTGMCRPEDVTAANSVLSSQIHDLRIEKMHKGELRDANRKGLFARILDTVFAF